MLRLTRQQRINNAAASMVTQLQQIAEHYRHVLKEGLDVKDEGNLPHLKATGEEVRAAMGENAQIMDNVLDYILGGKSNKIVREVKKKK